MDVGVGPVRVGHHEESVLALGPAHRQLIANVQRLLRVQFPRGEGLADLIAQHIGVPFLLPARDGFVPGLAQKKLAVSGEGVALVGADQGPVQGLFRVLSVVEWTNFPARTFPAARSFPTIRRFGSCVLPAV